MHQGFMTKLIKGKNKDMKVIVYGLNKVYCNGCTKELQHLQHIFACEDSMIRADKPEHEFRDLHCYNCMQADNFYCDKLEVNHVGGNHTDARAQLFICPVEIDLNEYIADITT